MNPKKYPWKVRRCIAVSPPWAWSAAGPGWANSGISRAFEVTESRGEPQGSMEHRTRVIIKTIQSRDAGSVDPAMMTVNIASGSALEAAWRKHEGKAMPGPKASP